MENAQANLADVMPRQVAMLVQGSEVYGIGTIEKLYASHWNDMTFVCLGGGPMHDWLVQQNLNTIRIDGLAKLSDGKSIVALASGPATFWRARRDAMRIHRRILPLGIRIIHAHWRPQQLIAGFLRKLGYISVWQINNNSSQHRLGGMALKLNHAMARWGADLLLPASDYIGRNWRGSGVPMKTVRNAAVPIASEPFPMPTNRPLRCMVAGRLVESKGHHVAVEAIGICRRSGVEIELDIYGGPLDSAYADQLRTRIESLGVSESVRLLGFCDDIRQRHSEYHLGLQCRLDPEPCSLWICETLVDGLPVIASATGGTPELVSDGETGYLYPPGDSGRLASRLEELANDSEKLAAMRRSAFERGRKHFTVDRFLNETLQAYAMVCKSPDAHKCLSHH